MADGSHLKFCNRAAAYLTLSRTPEGRGLYLHIKFGKDTSYGGEGAAVRHLGLLLSAHQTTGEVSRMTGSLCRLS